MPLGGYVPKAPAPSKDLALHFAPPRPQAPPFPRERLLGPLLAEPQAQLVGLFGGPGLGKSALLAELWRAQAGPKAWLGLEGVHDWASLAEGLALALRRALPGLPGLDAPLKPQQWVAWVAAEVEALAPEGLALALDDIPEAPELQAGLKALVGAWPGWLGLAGRRAPEGLGLASLQAKGQAVLVPAEALWLRPEEEAAFWAGSLDEAEAKAWHGRTRGWPLAVAMASAGLKLGATASALGEHLAEAWWPQLPEALAEALRLAAWGPWLHPDWVAQALAPLKGEGPAAEAAAALAQALREGLVPASQHEGGLWCLPEPLLGFLQGLPEPSREASVALALAWQQGGLVAQAWGLLLRLGAREEAQAWLREHGALALAEGRLGQLGAWLEAFPAAWREASGEHGALQGEWLRRSGRPVEAQACFQALLKRGGNWGPWVEGRARLGLAALEGAAGGSRFVALAVAAWAAVPVGDRLGQAEAANLRAAAALYAGQPELAAAAFEGAAAWAREAGAPALAAKATQNLGLALLAQGRVGPATQAYRQAMATAEAAGLPAPPMARANLAWALGLSGAWEAGRAEAQAAAASAQLLGQGRALAYARWAEGKILGLQGQLEAAQWAMEEALRVGQASQDRAVQVDALAGLAWLRLRAAALDGPPAPPEGQATQQPSRSEGQGAALKAAWAWVLQGEALAQESWHHPAAYELARPAAWCLAWQGERELALAGLRSLLGHPQLKSPPKRAQALALLGALAEGEEAATAQGLALALAAAWRLDGLGPLLAIAPGPPPVAPAPSPEGEAAPQPPQRLRLALLGPLAIRLGEAPFSPPKWASSRGPALLAFLALKADGATREQLEEAFLGGEGAARSGVATMIQRLRLALEPGLAQASASRFVLLEEGRYRLAGALWVTSDLADADAALKAAEALEAEGDGERALKAWAEAAALHRGALAEGLEGDWLEPEREAWRRRLGRAHQRLILGLLDDGQGAEAVEAAEDYARLDPLSEEAALRLTEALDAEGRRAEALQALQAFAARWGKALPGLPLPPEAAEVLRRLGGAG